MQDHGGGRNVVPLLNTVIGLCLLAWVALFTFDVFGRDDMPSVPHGALMSLLATSAICCTGARVGLAVLAGQAALRAELAEARHCIAEHDRRLDERLAEFTTAAGEGYAAGYADAAGYVTARTTPDGNGKRVTPIRPRS